jgi:hypothetical protein
MGAWSYNRCLPNRLPRVMLVLATAACARRWRNEHHGSDAARASRCRREALVAAAALALAQAFAHPVLNHLNNKTNNNKANRQRSYWAFYLGDRLVSLVPNCSAARG